MVDVRHLRILPYESTSRSDTEYVTRGCTQPDYGGNSLGCKLELAYHSNFSLHDGRTTIPLPKHAQPYESLSQMDLSRLHYTSDYFIPILLYVYIMYMLCYPLYYIIYFIVLAPVIIIDGNCCAI